MNTVNNTLLSIQGLSVKGNKHLLLAIDELAVNPGMQVAVVGANGSGKSTFIESLLGLRQLASGKVSWQCELKNKGVQLQQAGYNTDILVKEVIQLQRQVYSRQFISDEHDPLYDAFNLSSLANKKYGILSRGEKQRVDLYVAMAHQPRVLILDEPGTGLDKKYYQALITAIRNLQQQPDFTLLMASHSGLELSLASHLLWIEQGKIKVFDEKATLLDTTLGKVKAEIVSADPQVITAIHAQLSDAPQVNRLINPDPQQLIIYGRSLLKDTIMDISQAYSLKKFSVSETAEDDLLDLIGHSNIDVAR